jgi:phosphoribosylanthranilate isomerase
MRTRIKICCINSIDEAKLAIGAGADAIGLVGKMPSGPGPISDSLIHEISKSVPPLVGTFLLTSETSAKGIIDHHLRTGTNTIQIVDLITEGTHEQIRAALPSVKIVQVIHVIDAILGKLCDQMFQLRLMHSFSTAETRLLPLKNLAEQEGYITGN